MFFKKHKAKPISPQEELALLIKSYSLFKDDISCLGKHDHYDLIEETVTIRDGIHDWLQDIDVSEDVKSQISRLDQAWREWITQNKSSDFELVDINRDNIARSQWWFWIDQLDKLSEEDLKTI